MALERPSHRGGATVPTRQSDRDLRQIVEPARGRAERSVAVRSNGAQLAPRVSRSKSRILSIASRRTGLRLSSRSIAMGRFQEYSVIGRRLPSEREPQVRLRVTVYRRSRLQPKLYRMRIFAPNDVVAKSRFWYFIKVRRRA